MCSWRVRALSRCSYGFHRADKDRVAAMFADDLHPLVAAHAAVRLAWKQKTGDQSVLMVTLPAEISF